MSPDPLTRIGSPSQIIDGWWSGNDADAASVIRSHTEFARSRSVVLELAYGEYCVRSSRGQQIDPDAFCERFPSIRTSLCRRLEVHDLISSNALLLDHPEVDWPRLGDFLFGFRLVDELGRGGFSRVYLGEEVQLADRAVVVKVSGGDTAEAQTLAQLRHRNIVPVYATHASPSQSLSAAVMPYLGRHTLSDLIDEAFGTAPRRPCKFRPILDALREGYAAEDHAMLGLDSSVAVAYAGYVEAVVDIIRQVAEGLAHTHARGILHRDIKPSNVLFTPHGKPMLLDFNLARARNSVQILAGGTLPYMPPETIRQSGIADPESELSHHRTTASDEQLADERGDVFSLGVVFYELLAGQHPFADFSWRQDSARIGQQLLAHQARGPRPLEIAGPLDRRLIETVERCLAFDPDKRIQSAAELATRCGQLLRPIARQRRALRTSRRVQVSAAATLSMFVLGATWFGFEAYRRYRYSVNAATHFENPIGRSLFDNPYNPAAWIALGDQYAGNHQFDLALSAYHRAMELDPGPLTWSAVAYGILLSKGGKYTPEDAARVNQLVEQTIGAGMDSADLRNCRAFLALQSLASVDLAGEDVSRAYALNSADPFVAFNYAYYELARHRSGMETADLLRLLADLERDGHLTPFMHVRIVDLLVRGQPGILHDDLRIELIRHHAEAALDGGYRKDTVCEALHELRQNPELLEIFRRPRPFGPERFEPPIRRPGRIRDDATGGSPR